MNNTDMAGAGEMTSDGMDMGGMLMCDGITSVPDKQGNWQGHVFPGTIFLIWALHWLVSASWRHLMAQRNGRPFQARSAEGVLPMVHALNGLNRYPIESILKAIGGLMLFILQITYGGYKWLICPDGSGRAGRYATQHLNSWAHASMNLGFSLSGMVELLGMHSKLPQGTNMVVLSGAFLIEAMLFSMHEKNGHLDQTIHWLLAQTCWAGSVFSALEAAYPESFMLSAGRIGSMLLQGTWFIQAASVLFGGHKVWDDQYSTGHEDEAPAMFLPMVFTYHMVLLIAFMVAVYAALEALFKRMTPTGAPDVGSGNPSFGGFETSRLLSDDDTREQGIKSIAMSSMHCQ